MGVDLLASHREIDKAGAHGPASHNPCYIFQSQYDKILAVYDR